MFLPFSGQDDRIGWLSFSSRILAYSSTSVCTIEIFFFLSVFLPVKASSFLVSHPATFFFTLTLSIAWSVMLWWTMVIVVLFRQRSLLFSRVRIRVSRLRARYHGRSRTWTELSIFRKLFLKSALLLFLSLSLSFSLIFSLSFLLFFHFIMSSFFLS